jgi:hypothetical protein
MKTDAYVYIKTTIKRNAYGEWVVRLYLDGERQIGADYFASDRDDAVETADRMREEAAKHRATDRTSMLHSSNAVKALWAIYQEANLSDGDHYAGEYPSHAARSVCCPLEKAMAAMGVDVDLSCQNGELTYKSDATEKGGEA